MAFTPGQSGNPGGSRKEAIIRSHLLKAAAADDHARIRKGCEKILDLMAQGEAWACHFVADRLDGKPAQAITGADGNELVIRLIDVSQSSG